ncbi:alpha/beta family hydrolase [Thalassotalea litorea]|uniref:alpha/beta family hydrolase n=1 Tax=Thalassotalea litorea TaxID=2020715 RepID=UPI001BB22459|nr:alpha/beta family hydrolase [Thalassotalea litorea]
METCFDFSDSPTFDVDAITYDGAIAEPVATLIFAHGAGADKDSEFIRNVIRLLTQGGVHVLSFNFPYMQQRKIDGKRRPPNRMPALQQCFESVIDAYRGETPLFVGGKSMGSRVAMTLIEHEKIQGGYCFGYPFHPQKKPEKLRLEPLQQQTQPVLILQGQRDALGNEQEIESYGLGDNIKVVFYGDGDHDLKPRVKSGFRHQQHIEQSCEDLLMFIRQVTQQGIS